MTAPPATEAIPASRRQTRGADRRGSAPDASAKPDQSDTAAKPRNRPNNPQPLPQRRRRSRIRRPNSQHPWRQPGDAAKPNKRRPAGRTGDDRARPRAGSPGCGGDPNAATGGRAGENGTLTPAPSRRPRLRPRVADGNTAIAEKLRDLANGKFDRMIGGKKDRATIDAFYSSRDYAPLWLTDGKPNAGAKAAIAYLGQVDADGLDPADYPTPDFASLTDPAALAEAELRLSISIIAYAHHAQVGRVHWSRVSGDIYYDQKVPDPADVLANMSTPRTSREVLAAMSRTPGLPRAEGQARRTARRQGSAGQAPIPNGPAPKIGAQDERVPQLRERLGLPADDDTTYDKTLAEAVKQFQQEHELKPTGMLTPRPSTRSTAASPIVRSIPSSPIWNAGAGCRTISAGPTSWSIFPISRCASCTTASSCG